MGRVGYSYARGHLQRAGLDLNVFEALLGCLDRYLFSGLWFYNWCCRRSLLITAKEPSNRTVRTCDVSGIVPGLIGSGLGEVFLEPLISTQDPRNMPLASQFLHGNTDESSELEVSSSTPPAQALSIRQVQGRSDDSSSSGPVRRQLRARSSSSPMPSRAQSASALTRRPSPASPAVVPGSSRLATPMFAGGVPGPSQTPQTEYQLHLHRDETLNVGVEQTLNVGVDPEQYARLQSEAVHAVSQARNEASQVRTQAEAVVQTVIGQAHSEVSQARTQASAASEQAQSVQSEAQIRIADLQSQNVRLAEMNRELSQQMQLQAEKLREQQEFSVTLHQQLVALQSHVNAAEPPEPSMPQPSPMTSSVQNGADPTLALQELARQVGSALSRIEQTVQVVLSPKAKKPTAKKKASVKAIAPSIASPIPAKASGSSGLSAASPIGFGLPPYACSRRDTSTGRSRPATPLLRSPPPAPPKSRPQLFDIGDENGPDEPDEGEDSEDEEGFEDDPIVPVVDDDHGDVRDYESSIYRYKDLKDLRLPQIPASTTDFRAYRNSLLTSVASIDGSGRSVLLRWLQKCLDPASSVTDTRQFQADNEGLPKLDAWISANLCDAKHLKGDAGSMPSGRALLSILSRRYRVDKVRGPLVTLQSLFDLEPESHSYQSLVAFKQRVEYVLNGLPEKQWPDPETMFSWVYSRLKACRLLSRTIDRVKDSKPGSKRRTFEYIWNGLEEVLAEVREDRNEQALKESLKESETKQKQQAEAKAAAAKASPGAPASKASANPKAKGQGKEKPPKAPTKATPGVPEADAQGGGKGANKDKGKGKGKGGGKGSKASPNKPPPPKDSPAEQSGQRPACFFYPKGTCTRGKDCPFEHVEAPKKAAPSKATPKVPAGVALLAAASTGASACNIPSSFERGFKATCRLLAAPLPDSQQRCQLPCPRLFTTRMTALPQQSADLTVQGGHTLLIGLLILGRGEAC